jgi:acyl dehydratase
MPLDRTYAGKAYQPAPSYLVGPEKIREFAEAIGATDPAYLDPDAARALGHPDVIAPPTFPIVISITGAGLTDPELGLNYSMVVHGEQRFEYQRPLHAGDVVTAESTIAGIRSIGRNERLDLQTVIKTVDGEHVCTAHNVIIERGA